MAFTDPILGVNPLAADNTGTYKGFKIRVKGDGRVESVDPSDNTFMHRSIINAQHWIDSLETVVAPTCTLDSIDPATAVVGDPDVTVTLTGTGFTPSAALVWNGVQDTLTYVSDTELTTVVKVSLATVASTATVAVYQGGYTTPSLPFEFTEPI
jgi:IPT/TIG domain